MAKARSVAGAWQLSLTNENTSSNYASDVELWFNHCSDHGIDPLLVEQDEIDSWLKTRQAGRGKERDGSPQKKPDGDRTKVRRLSALSSFYNYCARLSSLPEVTHNPCQYIERPRIDPLASTTVGLVIGDVPDEDGVIHDQVAEFMEALEALPTRPAEEVPYPYRDRAAGYIVLGMGLRATGLVGRDVDDLGPMVDTTTGRTIFGLRVKLKGGGYEMFPVPEPVYQAYRDYFEHHRTVRPGGYTADERGGPLITSYRGNRMHRQWASELMRNIARGHPNLEPIAELLVGHSGRFSYCTALLDKGVPIEKVSAGMGHRSISTTQIYDKKRKKRSHGTAIWMFRKGKYQAEERSSVQR